MAAVTRAMHARVRAALPGEGAAIAALWRELWDAHQGWGGYPGTRDPAVYARLANRLDQDARVAWNACVEAASGARARSESFVARIAGAEDALAIARLEEILAARRRDAGDVRFDRPHAIDAALVTAIAGHLAADAAEHGDSGTLVAVDRSGAVRGAASAIVQTLDPPFVPLRRALVGRFALDPACPPAGLVASLVALGCRFAESRGASRVELTDLSAPGTSLYDAALAMGARPWSRVVLESVP